MNDGHIRVRFVEKHFRFPSIPLAPFRSNGVGVHLPIWIERDSKGGEGLSECIDESRVVVDGRKEIGKVDRNRGEVELEV
jgi:hypothetical protein